MVNVANSIETARRLGPTFRWMDFARLAWPEHPAFKRVSGPEQRARDVRRLKVKACTWLGRLVRRGLICRISNNPVVYRLCV